jgi:hypothetical protein
MFNQFTKYLLAEGVPLPIIESAIDRMADAGFDQATIDEKKASAAAAAAVAALQVAPEEEQSDNVAPPRGKRAPRGE